MRVAIFGPPGSGKTTSASRVTAKKGQIAWIEASRDIIERREFDPANGFLESHRSARAFFERASIDIGPDWAAQRVLSLAEYYDYVIVTGVRGIRNLRELKRRGFFIIYFDASFSTCSQRIAIRDGVSPAQAATYLDEEDKQFNFAASEAEADLVVNTEINNEDICEYFLYNACHTVMRQTYRAGMTKTCTMCANSYNNRSIFSANKELCDCCSSFRNRRLCDGDISSVIEDIRSNRCLVGMSGGKDSSVVIRQAMEMCRDVRSFTVDTGYYPVSMIDRAKKQSDALGIAHVVHDARQHMEVEIKHSFELTAQFFDRAANGELAPEELLDAYYNSREGLYSIKALRPAVFPRVCILCRKIVIRSYYEAARSQNAKYVLLGMNEWAALSAKTDKPVFSGLRRLQPSVHHQPVYVLHLPFVTGATLSRNVKALGAMGWQKPFGEKMVETNGNSCLLAKAAESLFFKAANFHPDSTRLSREVTVGFMSRGDAIEALRNIHLSLWSVRNVLEYARIL